MAQTIEIIANLALALSVIIAIIFGIAQVKAAERDRRERLTLETLRNFQTREFAEQLYFTTNFEFPKTWNAFKALPSKDQIALIQFSQQMENLGMLVYEKVIDLDLVDKTLGSYVSQMWERYKPVFFDMRKNMPDPYLGEYFQWLAERIAERLKNNPREPYYKVSNEWQRTKR